MRSLGFVAFLAWRNVLRYRRRSLQSFLVLLLGAFSVMLVDAFMRGYAAASTERILSVYGHFDLHAAGYLESSEAMPLDLAIAEAGRVADGLLARAEALASPGVRALAAASVEAGCMLSNGERSRPATLLATEVFARSGDPVPGPLNPLLRETSGALVAGRLPRAGEPGALLDAEHASRLGLVPGDSLILLGADAFGSFSMLESPVIGLVREASLPAGAGCVVDLASFAEAFGLGEGATSISLWLVSAAGELLDAGAEPDTIRALQDSLAGDGSLVARPFPEISATYTNLFEFLDVFLAGMMLVFAVVAAAGMTNTILLSVHERVKDLGTLRAIALTSRQASLLLYLEIGFLGVLAASLAFLLGFGLVGLLVSTGAGLRFEMADIGSDLPASIRPRLFPLRLLAISLVSALFPLLAAVLPSRTLRRLTIRESLGC